MKLQEVFGIAYVAGFNREFFFVTMVSYYMNFVFLEVGPGYRRLCPVYEFKNVWELIVIRML